MFRTMPIRPLNWNPPSKRSKADPLPQDVAQLVQYMAKKHYFNGNHSLDWLYKAILEKTHHPITRSQVSHEIERSKLRKKDRVLTETSTTNIHSTQNDTGSGGFGMDDVHIMDSTTNLPLDQNHQALSLEQDSFQNEPVATNSTTSTAQSLVPKLQDSEATKNTILLIPEKTGTWRRRDQSRILEPNIEPYAPKMFQRVLHDPLIEDRPLTLNISLQPDVQRKITIMGAALGGDYLVDSVSSDMSVNELLWIERVSMVALGCGWKHKAIHGLEFCLKSWRPMMFQPNAHDSCTPFSQVTKIITRIVQGLSQDTVEWEDRMAALENIWQKHKHDRILPNPLTEIGACYYSDLIAMEHLALTLHMAGVISFFSSLRDFWMEQREWESAMTLMWQTSRPRATMEQRLDKVYNHPEFFAVIFPFCDSIQKFVKTVLQRLLNWTHQQLISKPVLRDEVFGFKQLWSRARSIKSVEQLEQRLLVAFLSYQASLDPSIQNLHLETQEMYYLPLPIRQEWAPNTIPVLTLAVLSHMARYIWPEGEPINFSGWAGRRLAAFNDLMNNMQKTVPVFLSQITDARFARFRFGLPGCDEQTGLHAYETPPIHFTHNGNLMSGDAWDRRSFDLVCKVAAFGLDLDAEFQATTPLPNDRPLISTPRSSWSGFRSFKSIPKRALDNGKRLSYSSSYLQQPDSNASSIKSRFSSLLRLSQYSEMSMQKPDNQYEEVDAMDLDVLLRP